MMYCGLTMSWRPSELRIHELRSLALDLVLSSLSGILLVLSLPWFDLSFLAWIALVPLLVALEGKSLKEAFLLSYLTGLIFFPVVFSWILTAETFNVVDYSLFAAFFALYGGLFGIGLNWIRRRTCLPLALVAPPFWVTLEFIRSHSGFLSLPSMLLGHSQYLHVSLIQISSLTGVYGLSFLIVLMHSAIAETLIINRTKFSATATFPSFRSSLTGLMTAGLLLIAALFYGSFVLSKETDGDRLTVALVQGNAWNKWKPSYRELSLEQYSKLTRTVADHHSPALIIWPETAVPGDVLHERDLQKRLGALAVEAQSYLLVGSSEYAKFTDRRYKGKNYNSMVLVYPEGQI